MPAASEQSIKERRSRLHNRGVDKAAWGIMMKLPRREFLHLAAGVAALPTLSRAATAEGYPTRPVRFVVGFAPGGGNDITARLMGQWLSEHLGQPLVIENRPGAATNVATEAVVNATPDGYTLLFVSPTAAINATLYEKLNFNFIRDFAPIAGIMRIPDVMVVNPSFPAKTVREFIAYSEANPGKINMSSPGVGTTVHLSGELFKMMTGVDMVHVAYKGSAPSLTDLMGGQVQVSFATMPSAVEFIKSGKLRALAVTTATRSPVLPDVPTVGEFVPGYEVSSWYGISARRGTPGDVIDKINKETNAGLADPTMKSRLADLGGIPIAGSPDDFGKLIADETEKWAKVIRAANIKPE
jgi:tripartite-type tricarboxylate transporter receptor subunit TctC